MHQGQNRSEHPNSRCCDSEHVVELDGEVAHVSVTAWSSLVTHHVTRCHASKASVVIRRD